MGLIHLDTTVFIDPERAVRRHRAEAVRGVCAVLALSQQEGPT
jgi:hypothetical protein